MDHLGTHVRSYRSKAVWVAFVTHRYPLCNIRWHPCGHASSHYAWGHHSETAACGMEDDWCCTEVLLRYASFDQAALSTLIPP